METLARSLRYDWQLASGLAMADASRRTLGEDYHALWGLDRGADHLIMATRDYAVWLNKDLEVWWTTTESFGQTWDKKAESLKKLSEWGRIMNRVTDLQAVPINYLLREQTMAFRCMVGEAVVRLFEHEFRHADDMLRRAGRFVAARNQERARVWYVLASVGAAGALVSISAIGYLVYRLGGFGLTPYELLSALGAGAAGALLSVLYRVGKSPLDSSAGPALHRLEGAARILVGGIGGVVMLLAARSGLALSILQNSGFPGLLLAAFAGGVSERLVKVMIKRVELAEADKKEEEADAGQP
jgi:hypothetical protein